MSTSTSNPQPSILPVTTADIDTLGRHLFSSKLNLTINRLLYLDWPNEAVQVPQYTRAISTSLADPAVEDLKVVDEEGEMLGYVALTRRTASVAPASEAAAGAKDADVDDGKEGQAPPFEAPPGFNGPVLKAVMDAVGHNSAEKMEVDHYELTYILILPPHQSQGLGSRLINYCKDKARATGLPLYMGAEPQIYEYLVAKHGFTEVTHVDLELDELAPHRLSGFGRFRLAEMRWNP